MFSSSCYYLILLIHNLLAETIPCGIITGVFISSCIAVLLSSPPTGVTVNGIVYYTITRNDSLAIDCSLVPLTDTVYESNDTCYLSCLNQRYTMLYNWNALPGDTQKIYVDNFGRGRQPFCTDRLDRTINITDSLRNSFIQAVSPRFHNSFRF